MFAVWNCRRLRLILPDVCSGNVLKEIAEPAGALIHADAFQLGDPTISILELWGAEYQESNALLVRRKDKEHMLKLGRRERCPVSFVGTVTGSGKVSGLYLNFASRSVKGTIAGMVRFLIL